MTYFVEFMTELFFSMFLILSLTTFEDWQKNINAVNKFLNHDHDTAFYAKRHDRHDPDF